MVTPLTFRTYIGCDRVARASVIRRRMEIINVSQVEPHRLRAMTKLIADLEGPKRQDIINLLQPEALLAGNTSEGALSASKNTFRIAVDCKLVTDTENMEKVTTALVTPEQVATMTSFQQLMQNKVLGVDEENQPNYLFNLYSAWYAIQDERVFHELALKGYDDPFNTEIFPDITDDRRFNSTKFAAWRKWAAFLGLGWVARIGGRDVLVPDATVRLRNIIKQLFQDDDTIRFGQFMEQLATKCPELDGGKLFDYCWKASRGSEQRGNQVSLMVSTGLRTLDGLKVVKLTEQADSLNIWQLYPATGNPIQRVTHIQRLGV